MGLVEFNENKVVVVGTTGDEGVWVAEIDPVNAVHAGAVQMTVLVEVILL